MPKALTQARCDHAVRSDEEALLPGIFLPAAGYGKTSFVSYGPTRRAKSSMKVFPDSMKVFPDTILGNVQKSQAIYRPPCRMCGLPGWPECGWGEPEMEKGSGLDGASE
jgi:hypothetical protein